MIHPGILSKSYMMFIRKQNKRKRLQTAKNQQAVVFVHKKIKRQANHLWSKIYRIYTKRFVIIIVLLLFAAITVFGLLLKQIYLDQKYVSPIPRVNTVDNSKLKIDQNIAQELQKREIRYIRIDISSLSYYRIVLTNNSIILLAVDKDLKQQIASLQYILNRLTMEGRSFKKLDLRFNKPVITF
jgi:hypothetical protein